MKVKRIKFGTGGVTVGDFTPKQLHTIMLTQNPTDFEAKLIRMTSPPVSVGGRFWVEVEFEKARKNSKGKNIGTAEISQAAQQISAQGVGDKAEESAEASSQWGKETEISTREKESPQ